MSRALKSMNKKATEILDKRFKGLLLEGNWPEVEFKKTEYGGESFSMFAYAEKRSQFSKAIHNKVVEAGYEHGMFQNARNEVYMTVVNTIIQGLTISDVENSDRFRTMFD